MAAVRKQVSWKAAGSRRCVAAEGRRCSVKAEGRWPLVNIDELASRRSWPAATAAIE